MTSVSLVADSGASVIDSGDFFRSAAFLRAEKVSHSLVVRDGDSELVLPLVVRDIPGGGRDAISPYGYPGGALSGPAIDPVRLDFSPTGLVSIFVRDRVGAPVLFGGRLRNRILVHDPARPRTLRSDFHKQPRRNERRGLRTEIVAGPEADQELRAAFGRVYRQTMRRVGADESYSFEDGYLSGCLDAPSSWLAVVRGPGDIVADGAIVVRSDRMLHTFLSGTDDAHLGASPTKNWVVRLLDLADEWQVPVNFGGGMRAADTLERFKQGFTNAEERLVTHEIICDPVRYDELVRLRCGTATNFFPAYRH